MDIHCPPPMEDEMLVLCSGSTYLLCLAARNKKPSEEKRWYNTSDLKRKSFYFLENVLGIASSSHLVFY